MTNLLGFLADFGTILHGAAVMAGAFIAMGVLRRLLQRGEGPPTGRHAGRSPRGRYGDRVAVLPECAYL